MRVMQSTVVVNQLYHKRHLKMFYAVRMLGRCSRVSICNLTTLNARRQFGKGPRSRYLQTESKSAWRTWDAVEKAPGLRGGIYMRKKSVDYGYQIVFFKFTVRSFFFIRIWLMWWGLLSSHYSRYPLRYDHCAQYSSPDSKSGTASKPAISDGKSWKYCVLSQKWVIKFTASAQWCKRYIRH